MLKHLTTALLLTGAMMTAHAEVNMSPATPPHEQPRALPPSAEDAAATRHHYQSTRSTDRGAYHHRAAPAKAHYRSHKTHKTKKAHHQACGVYKHRSSKTGHCVWNANHPHSAHHR